MRAKDRIDRAEPKWKKSNTEIEEPNFEMPKSDTSDPKRA
jgi:hypothetical protein